MIASFLSLNYRDGKLSAHSQLMRRRYTILPYKLARKESSIQ
jgi:hypothetical protein